MKTVTTLSFAVLLAAFFLTGCGEDVPAPEPETEPAAGANAEAAANALAEGTYSVVFPTLPKQAVSFTSDALERIAGTVDFAAVPDAVGEATFNVSADGVTGEASFTIPVTAMRTGVTARDEHMRGEGWLNAETYPAITYTVTGIERVEPTVWRVTGTWSLHGVEKEITTLANVRWIGDFPGLDGQWLRIAAAFDLPITEFGVNGGSIEAGTVAPVWQIEVAFLGQVQE